MNLRFLGIGKANAEIERLEKALLDEQAKTVKFDTDLKAAHLALSENNSEVAKSAEKLSADLTKATSDLTAANSKITTLESSVAALTKERDEAKATIADPKGAIQTAASAKAATITAGQGQPPIAAAATTSPGAAKGAKSLTNAEFMALGHSDRMAFVKAGGKVTE